MHRRFKALRLASIFYSVMFYLESSHKLPTYADGFLPHAVSGEEQWADRAQRRRGCLKGRRTLVIMRWCGEKKGDSVMWPIRRNVCALSSHARLYNDKRGSIVMMELEEDISQICMKWKPVGVT